MERNAKRGEFRERMGDWRGNEIMAMESSYPSNSVSVESSFIFRIMLSFDKFGNMLLYIYVHKCGSVHVP